MYCTGGEKLRRRRDLTVEQSRRNSGEAGSGLRGKEFGEIPGATAKLLRWLARNKGQRSGGTTAARSLGPAMARRRWLWGAEAAVERRGCAQGWSRGLIKDEAVILGAGRWQASPGDLGGILRGENGSRPTDCVIPGSGCCF